ncbi:DNA/RNA non-specific endonuclease [Petropleomorpha daqingensis]|uniref:Endonuclease G n=1 Tax=Petropleomorpha daqingensis TaxID=2026353 RepID=A0A853CEY3_9ACTN|nr:DNA/RNA non-specific endonuclease [Petropleomorpha daqingensis]NYJ06434.1 endonuclease G [Petropleomorpha daqingensis]
MTVTDDRLEAVRARLRGSPELEQAVRDAVAAGSVPGIGPDVVRPDAADVLAAGSQPLESVVRIDALEAIVRRVGRPPLMIRNDAVVLEPLPDFPTGTDTKIKHVEVDIRSVGRVEFLNHTMAWGGTGWVIASGGSTRVVVTNRHVAKLVARRGSDGRGVFLRSPATGVLYGIDLDFKEEVGSAAVDARPFEVSDILYLADDTKPDIALLRISGDALPDPLPLSDDDPEPGDLVALVGYPAFDTRNDVDDQARYFHDIYDVKRFAPGKVMQALTGRTELTHDCTSLGGNSGSPLISLETGEVVGLHFSGQYGIANSAVGVGSLKAALAGGSPVVIPVQPGPQEDAEAAGDGAHTAADLADRAGYDPAFLGEGLAAPWPGVPDAVRADLAHPSDETPEQPFELRYTHFGVRFSTSRRQPVMTAVNIDGEHSVRVKRTRDRWFTDGRIAADAQLGARDYDDPQIDRGHMVRREDPNWDADPAGTVAALANGDTFHYTNAAPQHSLMNQGKQLWQGLENYVLDSARTHGFRACVFTGPVARDDDPEIKPGVLAPREFWKLVAMQDADGPVLHATAYLLSQGDLIRELLEQRRRTEAVEGFELGAYRTFQIAIRDLADATGYDFSAYLAADPLRAPDEAVEDAEPRYLPLESEEDVVM